MTAHLLVVGLAIASAVLIIGGEIWAIWHDRRYTQHTDQAIRLTRPRGPEDEPGWGSW